MRKVSASIIALALALLMCVCTAFAATPGIAVELSSGELMKSENAQTVKLTVKATQAMDLSAYNFTVVLPEGFSITDIESGDANVKTSELKSDSNIAKNYIAWSSSDSENYSVTVLAVLTISVPANAEAKAHAISIKDAVSSKDYGMEEVWKTGNTDVTAATTLTIKPDPSQHEHVWSDKWTTDGSKHWHTCTVAGCTAKNDEAAHSSTGNNAATCTTAAKCDVCEVSYGTALGHKWTAATCTAPKTCSVCKATEGNALGHDWNKTTWGSDAENHFHKCSRCDATTDVAAHTFGDGVVTLLPTIEKDGVKTFTCSVCKATKTEAIPKLADTDANKDQSAANDVINKINAIGKVTTKSGDAIKAAREAYDKLTDAQKELAKDALSVLEAAEKEYARLTAAPDHSGRNYPAKGGSTTTTKDGKTVESGKTFDAGIALYVGLSVLSVTGGALVIGKKKEF